VTAGRRFAGKFERLACERYLADRRAEKTKAFRFKFDHVRAERACRFMEVLPHVKGRWARKDPKNANARKLKLEGWQCFVVCNLFGWLRKGTEFRRFRKGSVYLPRKNGKSTLAAGIGWYMFAMDGEPGAEVYSGATTEKQAWEVFGPARQMAIAEPLLPDELGVTVNASNLIRLDDASKFEPIIGKPGDGASPHCAIVDEYHEHPTADLYDTMLTGMGARDQPLHLVISTAGYDISGPCYDDWLTVQKVLEGTADDPTHFGIIYASDPEDDWTSEVALLKANPNAGVSVSVEFLQSQLRDAIGNPRKQGVFKTKHLNLWQNARDAFINMQRYAECKTAIALEQLEGQPCFIGLDLASKIDIAAVELLFPRGEGRYARFGRYYLPDETVQQPENDHYRAWARAGLMTVTEGNIIDFSQILEDIEALAKRFKVESLAYDPFQATMLVTELMNAGLPCVEVKPTVLNLSEPMKQIDALIRDRKLQHDGDPIMTWMMSNVVAKVDAKDNVYPRKERPELKIDGFVALCMAMARAMTAGERNKEYQVFFL
jgi:phage terminase large subunit-like protein